MTRDPSSFRDPSGFVFRDEHGVLYRQVNACYAEDFRAAADSGLLEELIEAGLLIEHDEVSLDHALDGEAAHVLRPREVPWISYPYEWPFSALKQAALVTLEIQLRALRRGLTLKDASAYNIQFIGPRPVFIDTLSFERYRPGEPWKAYGQFCRHFLAPLALMAYRDIRLGRLLSIYLDGIPLDLASKLLPRRTRLRLGLLVHLHLQAHLVDKYSDTSKQAEHRGKLRPVSPQGLTALIENLRNTVKRLTWNAAGTEWVDYYSDTSYSQEGFDEKIAVVTDYLQRTQPATVWDLGANTGVFSRLASRGGALTCAIDVDPACTERHYLHCCREGETRILPLCIDLSNPSSGLGWAHEKRRSLAERGPADLVLALALIHHLAISQNIPLEGIARFFRRLGQNLVVEFVPKSDPQSQRLLRGREDIFGGYHQAGFEAAFSKWFRVVEARPVGTDGRVLYLMAG